MTLADIRGALGMMSPEGRMELEREAAQRGVSVENHFIDSYLDQTGEVGRQLYSLQADSKRPRLRVVEQ
ncbi:hypothetical protein [Salinicola sp. DM10]|uniref:hypothetical protein n=1 Tax=Salinicola sp. DM10 TaxID=2815721 RepID=UPI001A8F7E5A|nr:hypothetical protein [Salinicola sp. DM10]MCE3025756.1 hypothetical protein [Salinicola sp. DM10]